MIRTVVRWADRMAGMMAAHSVVLRAATTVVQRAENSAACLDIPKVVRWDMRMAEHWAYWKAGCSAASSGMMTAGMKVAPRAGTTVLQTAVHWDTQ